MTTGNGLLLEAFLAWIEDNQGAQARKELEAFIRGSGTPEERGVFVRGLPAYRAFIRGEQAPPPAPELAITTPERADIAVIERQRAARAPAVEPAPAEAEPTEAGAIRERLISFVQGEILTDPQTGKFYDWRQFSSLNELLEISPQEAQNIQRDVAVQRGRLQPPTELTPAELEQQRQFGETLEQRERARRELTEFERVSLEQRERELQATGREAGLRAQLERERFLSSLSGPRDWIKRWYAEHAAGPSPRAQALERLRATETRLATLQEQIATDLPEDIGSLAELTKALETRIPPLEGKKVPTGGLGEQLGQLSRLQSMRATLTRAVEQASTEPVQALPRVPERIAQFIPDIAGGERLRAARIRTPSPQQLGRVGSEVFQGLLGFADFASAQNVSRTGTQLIEDIERMLPGQRGQLTRIRPARQRA